MPDVVIRACRPADRPALTAMIARLQDAERTIHWSRAPGGQVAEPYFAKLEDMVAKRSGAVFIAAAGGRAVGFVSCWVVVDDDPIELPEARRHGYISDVFVDAAWRGHGLARRLIAAAEAHLAGRGVGRVLIGSLADNAAARAAYERVGYRAYEVVYEKVLDTAEERRTEP